MKKYMILFSIGKDRPGIVDDVSSFLFERGANIEDSRMAALGGCFSMMTLYSCNPEQADIIKGDLKNLVKLGLECSLHETEGPDSKREAGTPLKIDVKAMDHPGIVQSLVHILRRHDANIQSLNTQVSEAPLSGAPLFALELEADVPLEVSLDRLEEELKDIASKMNLDLNINI